MTEATTTAPNRPHPLRGRIAMTPGVRQYALAARVGVNDSYLSQMLTGQKPMSAEIEKALVEALDEIEAGK